MLSTIKFDLDSENNPIIVVKYKESDDLRDKVVKRFMEGFRWESKIAHIQFTDEGGSVSTGLVIKPISDVNAFMCEHYPIKDEQLIDEKLDEFLIHSKILEEKNKEKPDNEIDANTLINEIIKRGGKVNIVGEVDVKKKDELWS